MTKRRDELREAAQNLVWGCEFDELVGAARLPEAFKKDLLNLRAALTDWDEIHCPLCESTDWYTIDAARHHCRACDKDFLVGEGPRTLRERVIEECAKVCDGVAEANYTGGIDTHDDYGRRCLNAAAKEIRSLQAPSPESMLRETEQLIGEARYKEAHEWFNNNSMTWCQERLRELQRWMPPREEQK